MLRGSRINALRKQYKNYNTFDREKVYTRVKSSIKIYTV